MSEYEKQANDFLTRFGLRVSINYLTHEIPKWEESNVVHPKYRVRIIRENKSVSFIFYDSIANDLKNERPTAYDVLACISNDTYVYDDFEDFCDNFGYSNDSIRALNIYREYNRLAKRLNRFLSEEELEALREIQ